jgi:hypothetical protein
MSGTQKQINFSNEFRQGCRRKTVAEDVALSMHPHPTLSEGEEEAAEVFLGSATHILGRRKTKAGSD